MKTKFFIIGFIFLYQNFFGQNLHLKIFTKETKDSKVIDSINFKKKHNDVKSITNEINTVTNLLIQKGYLALQSENLKKDNDSIFTTAFILGKKTSHIYIITNSETTNHKKDTVRIKIEECEEFLKSNTSKLEKIGQPLAQLQLTNFRKQNNKLFTDLQIKHEITRKIDDIILEGNHKFPKNHLSHLKKKFLKKTFNDLSLKKLTKEIEKFNFVKQTKNAEGLFTKDSTKIYLYLKNNNSNTFDGFIGFNNIEKKLNINGYLDLKLINILNSGEKIHLFWKSNGNQQRSFDANIELPYIFKSAFALKAQLNIFKQDSTFQNGKTEINLGYYLKQNTKIYIGYQNTESTDIQNKNNETISDFKSSFSTLQLDYTNATFSNSANRQLIPEKTKIDIKSGFGRRENNNEINKQFFTQINIKHIIYLNNNNSINFSNQNFYLRSKDYIINELNRFGGTNSIRGFNENSLQGNLYTLLLTEYRYFFNPNFYIHSIIDYGYFQDKTTKYSTNLKSFGGGIGLATNNGIFNLAIAKGFTNSQQKNSQNSIFHITYKLHF